MADALSTGKLGVFVRGLVTETESRKVGTEGGKLYTVYCLVGRDVVKISSFDDPIAASVGDTIEAKVTGRSYQGRVEYNLVNITTSDNG